MEYRPFLRGDYWVRSGEDAMTQTLTVYRRSELESADCLFRYRSIWLDGVDDTSDFALRGIAFHKIKHRYIEALVAHQIPQDFDLAKQAFIDGIAAAQTPSRLIPEIRELWDRHAEHFELSLERFVAAEEKQEGGGFAFTPDLVLVHPERNELEIQDDKTFFVALTEAQARASFQARFYIQHAMARWPNFATYRFTFCFVRFGKFVSIVFTEADLDKLDREVEADIAKIEYAKLTGSWPATAGPSCTYCELKCPIADQELLIPKRFTSMQQAQQIGSWILAGEQAIKTAKKALKAYSAAYGPVDIGGVEWANRPVTSKAYPIDQVLAILNKRGIAGAFEEASKDGLTISHSALSKLFKKYPALQEDLAGVVIEKESYRFSAKKPGGDPEGEFDE